MPAVAGYRCVPVQVVCYPQVWSITLSIWSSRAVSCLSVCCCCWMDELRFPARRLEQLVQKFAGRHLRRHLVGGAILSLNDVPLGRRALTWTPSLKSLFAGSTVSGYFLRSHGFSYHRSNPVAPMVGQPLSLKRPATSGWPPLPDGCLC